MTEYQATAIKVYHDKNTTFAAKEIAYELLINSGMTREDINLCKGKDARKLFYILAA